MELLVQVIVVGLIFYVPWTTVAIVIGVVIVLVGLLGLTRPGGVTCLMQAGDSLEFETLIGPGKPL